MYASEDHLVLLPQTIVSPTEYDACASITAGIHVLITCGGQLNLRTPVAHLAPGFIIDSGGTLNVVSDVP